MLWSVGVHLPFVCKCILLSIRKSSEKALQKCYYQSTLISLSSWTGVKQKRWLWFVIILRKIWWESIHKTKMETKTKKSGRKIILLWWSFFMYQNLQAHKIEWIYAKNLLKLFFLRSAQKMDGKFDGKWTENSMHLQTNSSNAFASNLLHIQYSWINHIEIALIL